VIASGAGSTKGEDDPAHLKAAARRLGITPRRIAAEAAKTSPAARSVSRPFRRRFRHQQEQHVHRRRPSDSSSKRDGGRRRRLKPAQSRKQHSSRAVIASRGAAARGRLGANDLFLVPGEKTSAKIAAAHRALTGAATSVREAAGGVPQRVGAGHPALAQHCGTRDRARRDRAGRGMLARTRVALPSWAARAGSRGINTAVVRAADALVAQGDGRWVPTPARRPCVRSSAGTGGARRAAAACPAGAGQLTRRDGRRRTRRQLEIDRRKDRADLSRAHIACESCASTAARRPRRQMQRVARAARLSLSNVSKRYRVQYERAGEGGGRGALLAASRRLGGTPVTTSVFASRRGPLFCWPASDGNRTPRHAQLRQSSATTRRRATLPSVTRYRRLVIGLPAMILENDCGEGISATRL